LRLRGQGDHVLELPSDDFSALVGRVVEVSLIANPGKIWLMVEPVDMRRGIDGLSTLVQAVVCSACALCWFGFCVLQSRRQSHQGAAVGRHRRVVVPAPFASGAVRLGTFGYDGMELTSSQWEWLIAGVDWRRLGLQSCARKYS
jgi:transposase